MPIANEVIVGLDDEAKKVIDRLVGGPAHVEIVPIVGMAGIGKTTLAKKVYSHNSIIYEFHIRLWGTVSQKFNRKSLLTQILSADGKYSRMNDLDEHTLLQKLYQKLKGNQYLVVLDDVWDLRAWNELRYSFPDDKNRSRILFTSRFSNVALQVQYGGEPHCLRPLNKKESFKLLQKKVFGKEDCPQALSGFMMEIAKKCRGLPLALVVVAGVLATKEHAILVWKGFAKCLTSKMLAETNQCKESLELSFEHLPNYLQDCLLYFAAFQQDKEIDAENLMRLWIAEGFVVKKEERPEDVAEEYLTDLIDRNLVMVRKIRPIGGVKTCYIHDLIFEFCKAKAKAKNFLQVLRGCDELSAFDGPPDLSRLSIYSSGKDFIKSRLVCPHLGSLLLFVTAPRNCDWFTISFLFCNYKHLKVLKLEGIYLKLKKLPTAELPLCLRYLALTAHLMQSIPPSIAKLSHLETFCLGSKWMVSLPDSIWNMENLRHLYVWDGSFIFPLSSNDNVAKNPPSTLPNLDTLSGLYLSFDQGENLWTRIPNIRHLRISNGETGNGVCDMSCLKCLESLTLDVSKFSRPRDHFKLSFPMNLKELSLSYLRLPWNEMSLIEQLPKLEVLELGLLAFEGKRWELMEGGFPELRVLTLSHLDDIVQWTETDTDSDDYFPSLQQSHGYFPSLQQLKLNSVLYLKTVPSCLERISTLETIEVMRCGDVVNSLVLEIEEAQKIYGNKNLKVIFRKY